MGSKCLAWGASHMCKKKSYQKSCPLKPIFGISGNLCISGYKPKYSYTIMYECENSLLPHELS